LIEQDN